MDETLQRLRNNSYYLVIHSSLLAIQTTLSLQQTMLKSDHDTITNIKSTIVAQNTTLQNTTRTLVEYFSKISTFQTPPPPTLGSAAPLQTSPPPENSSTANSTTPAPSTVPAAPNPQPPLPLFPTLQTSLLNDMETLPSIPSLLPTTVPTNSCFSSSTPPVLLPGSPPPTALAALKPYTPSVLISSNSSTSISPSLTSPTTLNLPLQSFHQTPLSPSFTFQQIPHAQSNTPNYPIKKPSPVEMNAREQQNQPAPFIVALPSISNSSSSPVSPPWNEIGPQISLKPPSEQKIHETEFESNELLKTLCLDLKSILKNLNVVRRKEFISLINNLFEKYFSQLQASVSLNMISDFLIETIEMLRILINRDVAGWIDEDEFANLDVFEVFAMLTNLIKRPALYSHLKPMTSPTTESPTKNISLPLQNLLYLYTIFFKSVQSSLHYFSFSLNTDSLPFHHYVSEAHLNIAKLLFDLKISFSNILNSVFKTDFNSPFSSLIHVYRPMIKSDKIYIFDPGGLFVIMCSFVVRLMQYNAQQVVINHHPNFTIPTPLPPTYNLEDKVDFKGTVMIRRLLMMYINICYIIQPDMHKGLTQLIEICTWRICLQQTSAIIFAFYFTGVWI